MEFEFQLSDAEIIKFYKLSLKDKLQRQPILPIVVIAILTVVLAGNTFLWSRFLFSIIASLLIVLTLLYYLPLCFFLIRLKLNRLKKPLSFEKKKIIIVDEGLKIESSTKNDLWKWDSIQTTGANKEFLYFNLIDKNILLVPKKAFNSESEAINFLGLVQSKVFEIRGTLTPNNIPRHKPPYWLGLLCFIPLIGAFVGIGLLMYGILMYKDKWLIIIGIAGVLFTVGIYYSQMHELKFGEQSGKAFAEISQMELNTLMKDIEFYKIKHGAYPDSLAQISKEDSMALIWDPIQSRQGKSVNFNYKKAGGHYYLFSSGVDGLPNTKDDLYPQVADSDRAKFGLIRK